LIETIDRKISGKWVLIALSVGIILALSCVFAYIQISAFLNRPKPEVILLDGYESFRGFLNYVYVVDVGVKNNGEGGWITVYAEITGMGKYEEQSKQLYLENNQEEILKFVFDVSVWGALTSPSIQYRAWVVV